MSTTIQLRRGTTTEWLVDPILADGEIGLDTTLNQIKIGNGTDTWSVLPFFGTSTGTGNQHALFQQIEATGVNGGTAGAGNHVRTLNNEIYNDITGCTLVTNEITLDPGTYKIDGFATSRNLDQITGIYETSANPDFVPPLIMATNPLVDTNMSPVNQLSILQGVLVVTVTTAYKLISKCSGGGNDWDFGLAHSINGTNVYVGLSIEKIA